MLLPVLARQDIATPGPLLVSSARPPRNVLVLLVHSASPQVTTMDCAKPVLNVPTLIRPQLNVPRAHIVTFLLVDRPRVELIAQLMQAALALIQVTHSAKEPSVVLPAQVLFAPPRTTKPPILFVRLQQLPQRMHLSPLVLATRLNAQPAIVPLALPLPWSRPAKLTKYAQHPAQAQDNYPTQLNAQPPGSSAKATSAQSALPPRPVLQRNAPRPTNRA